MAREEIRLRIGDCALSVLAAEPLAGLVRSRYGAFVEGRRPRGSRRHGVRLHAEVAGGSSTPQGTGAVRATASGGLLRFRRGDFQLDLPVEGSEGSLAVRPAAQSLDSALRIALGVLLARRGGFLMHAASLVRDGAAEVFAGPSGSGKSTLASLCPAGSSLLSDEISVLDWRRRRLSAFGSPFWGEMRRAGEPAEAPVRGLYFLSPGSPPSLRRLGPAETLARLLRNVLFFAREPALVRPLFAGAVAAARTVPGHELGFVPDHTLWEVL